MPTKTFERLNAEKKNRLTAAAISEFAAFSYNRASLSQIVKSAGIAKGSIYQYFADKSDMYTYLVEFISEEKLSFINDQADQESDFFPAFKKMLLTGTVYDVTNPEKAMLLTNAVSESDSTEVASTVQWIQDRLYRFMYDFVTARKKTLGKAHDPVFLSVYLQSVVQVVPQTLIRTGRFPDISSILKGDFEPDAVQLEVERCVDTIIAVLKQGILASTVH